MGKSKVTMHRIEKVVPRQNTYSKRKSGLLKKASEIATLCDVDLAVLTFSPGGRCSQFVSQGRDLSDIIGKLSELSFKDRTKGKSGTITSLQKLYKDGEHVVEARKFSDDKNDKIQDLQTELKQLQEKLALKEEKLSAWVYPACVEDPTKLKVMEETLVQSMDRLLRRKEQLTKQRGRKPWHATRAHRVPWLPLDRLVHDPDYGFIHGDLGSYGNTAGRNENINEGIRGFSGVGLRYQPYPRARNDP